MKSRLPDPKAVLVVRAAVALGIILVISLDVDLKGSHSGVVAAVAGVAALPLWLPPQQRSALVTGAATLGATFLLGADHWRERPIVIGATLVNITLLASLAHCLGRTPSGPVADTGPPDSPHTTSTQIGDVRVEMRALPATAGGCMTAGFCGLRPTPFGVRLLVVDFVGRDTATREEAASVLYPWTRAAAEAPGLAESTRRPDTLLAKEDLFAKALLAGVAEDGTTTLLCCGHPPPLVVEGRTVHPVALVSLLPPLGLFDLGRRGHPHLCDDGPAHPRAAPAPPHRRRERHPRRHGHVLPARVARVHPGRPRPRRLPGPDGGGAAEAPRRAGPGRGAAADGRVHAPGRGLRGPRRPARGARQRRGRVEPLPHRPLGGDDGLLAPGPHARGGPVMWADLQGS
ncbi:SpoIIE family protein phosphatase [Streptomyces arenae]|nr:SpoIIE family protein phosphatase [Streptomyces arenae]